MYYRLIHAPNRYDIVYKAISKRYYPRCNGYFIYYTRAEYELTKTPAGCLYGPTKERAIEIINEYKEFLGLTDKIIPLD